MRAGSARLAWTGHGMARHEYTIVHTMNAAPLCPMAHSQAYAQPQATCIEHQQMDGAVGLLHPLHKLRH